MDIVKGTVTTNLDPERKGYFWAYFESITKEALEVTYTSPFYRCNGGGLLGIPEEGDSILCAHDVNSGDIYYQSTIVSVSENMGPRLKIPDFNAIPGTAKIYSDTSKPVKVQYGNQVGAGLEITRNYRPAPQKIISSTVLRSEGGKRVSLNDSPGVEAVLVKNQHGDGLTIKGDSEELLGARCISLKSNGTQEFTVFESSMHLNVIDGRDMHLRNTSTGAMAQSPNEEDWPNGKQPCRRYGGIYLKSDNGDISLASKVEDGRIFIVTPNARIQITDTGDIQLDATTDIQIRSYGDINMEGENINIKANGALSLESGGATAISGGGDVNIDGGPNINLNSGAPAPTMPTMEENDLNDYYD